ncbi:unnamed protein product [Adineta ricciae]|uniref:Uncharacterized protein n=1 Tax=Adineta ricciae TaxID=249248 RepID=A0A814I6L2_ADIRI|nr:unnamed protein product [Adineta ricciae]CAF1019809.1 unnamed protein product [Adineta ricciae]
MFRALLLICLAHFTIGETISGRVLLNGSSSSTTRLPSGCQLIVQVISTTTADGPATVLGNTQYSNVASLPTSYSLTYTPPVDVPIDFQAVSAYVTCPTGARYLNDYRIPVPKGNDVDTVVDINVIDIRGGK